MSTNLSIQAPDFPRIKEESGTATQDAIKLIWQALNFEMGRRRQEIRIARERFAPKVLPDASTGNQNNYDLEGASILMFSNSSSINFTGFLAPSEGESRILYIHNIGSGTKTIVHNSGSSDSANRVVCFSAANIAIGQDQSAILLYLNSFWREVSLA